jgi:hypothetical protein
MNFYETIKNEIINKYSNYFIASKLCNDNDFIFEDYKIIIFDILTIFFANDESIELIDSIDMKINVIDEEIINWLKANNIEYEIIEYITNSIKYEIIYILPNTNNMDIIFKIIDRIIEYKQGGR